MLRLFRKAMGNGETRETFECFGEIGETYLSEKPR
jgi:hypothetical protein